MTDDNTPPLLRVIDGSSTSDDRKKTPSTPPALRVVSVRNVPSIQLGLPIADARPEMVVSVGYYGLTAETLQGLVHRHAPRFFVDLRLAPSFNTGSLSRHFVADLFSQFRIQYVHLSELANRFIGTTLDSRAALDTYAEYVVQTSQFSQLTTMLGHGPIVLLSGGHRHEESERTVLVDALRTHCARLDLVIWNEH